MEEYLSNSLICISIRNIEKKYKKNYKPNLIKAPKKWGSLFKFKK